MKRKLIAILAAAAMMMSLFTLPVMAENTDKQNTESGISTDVSEETDGTAEEEIKGGLMALTFDDGPSKATITLLDELKKRDIQATFFVVGKRLDEFSDVLMREYKEGHEIGNHTWDHTSLTQMDSTTANQNLQKTEDKIYEIIGEDIGPLIIRPTYGSVNDTVRGYVDTPLILWSIDTLDWKYRDADAVKQRIINQADDGAI
ncbi:MAG: polysaccharide deacetylase family protein, partial [Firmicutes bacterium]|nr:polysaccharide deacetylase family protein [Bacillota bacterium]